MTHVVENLESAARSKIGLLTESELNLIKRVQKKYSELGYIGCTKCDYCQPCPHGVFIPDILEILNLHYTSPRDDTKTAYHTSIPETNRASNCEQCGECEEQCPQGLPIMNLMRGTSRSYDR